MLWSLVRGWRGWGLGAGGESGRWLREGGGLRGAGYLVGCWVVAEADVAVDAEVDVLEGEFRDGGVCGDDLVHEGRHEGLPVLERAAVLGVVGFNGFC